MSMQRFKDFWQSEKSIIEPVFFSRDKGHSHTYVFGPVELIGEHCERIRLTGDYNCQSGTMAFNFHLVGVGAVKRFCLGGPKHGDAGRFHEHVMEKDEDAFPMNNLPHAIPRDDLRNLTPEVAWRTICGEAKIANTAVFHDPREWCK